MFKMSFLQMHTQTALKKNKFPRASTPYKHAQSIGIIFTVEDKQKHEDVKELIKRFEQDGKNVSVLEFLPKKKDNYEFLFDFFSETDVTFWGKISSDRALKFSETPFDYLFYIDCESNPMILNLLAHSKARCRVGCFHEVESPYYELMIDHRGASKILMTNMYDYAKRLK
jgi:hypothetical protein